nr:MAG TPA: hypothetical protein [Caudoviricetes sp.]
MLHLPPLVYGQDHPRAGGAPYPARPAAQLFRAARAQGLAVPSAPQ